jgi:single-strand DNA-binding protein
MTEAPEPTDDIAADSRGDPEQNTGHRNEVLLVGRLSGDLTEHDLRSGSHLVAFRVVVDRDAGTQGRRHDALDCAIWSEPLQRAIRRWTEGDLIEVRGALRRRFWRRDARSESRCEVEVVTARRLAHAAAKAKRTAHRNLVVVSSDGVQRAGSGDVSAA